MNNKIKEIKEAIEIYKKEILQSQKELEEYENFNTVVLDMPLEVRELVDEKLEFINSTLKETKNRLKYNNNLLNIIDMGVGTKIKVKNYFTDEEIVGKIEKIESYRIYLNVNGEVKHYYFDSFKEIELF